MTCNPKINFLGDRVSMGAEAAGFFMGFHSGVMKERLVDYNFYRRFLTRQVNEQFHSH